MIFHKKLGTIEKIKNYSILKPIVLYFLFVPPSPSRRNGIDNLFRRIDDDRGKSYELGQSAVKCMRGILACWVRQAEQVELFKKHQCNKHALHSKFNLKNGDIIHPVEGYPHLQVNTG